MENFKKPSEKKTPSGRSIGELMELLMKLNSKLHEKIAPRSKKEAGPENVDVVIIIMTTQEMKDQPAKTNKPAKPQPSKGDWINGLCEEIEQGARAPK